MLWETFLLIFISLCLMILVICYFVYSSDIPYSYWYYRMLPYKKLDNPPIRPKILLGMLSIDRDADIAPIVYEKLNSCIKYSGYDVDIVIITRQQDTQIIDFWTNKAHAIITVPNYSILVRHNYGAITDKYNRLVQYAKDNNYTHIFNVESDIGVPENILSKLYDNLKDAHVTLACGIIPWAGTTVAYTTDIIPKQIRPETQLSPFPILGSGLMCNLFDITVFKDVKFNVKSILGIHGQDVGLFHDLFINRYKVVAITDMVEHYYNRVKTVDTA